MFELAGVGHVRAATQVFEIAFAVQADRLVGRNAANDFRFVMLTYCLEVGHRLIAWQFTTHHRLVFGGQLGHALFNRDQVLRREGATEGKVVIKAVFNDGTDRDLRLRKQSLDRISQQVCRGMTDQFEAFRVLDGHYGQLGISGHAEAGVDQLPIDLATQGCLGQASANRGCHFCHGDRARKFAQ